MFLTLFLIIRCTKAITLRSASTKKATPSGSGRIIPSISAGTAPGYIERTLIVTVKLWLQNLTNESLTTLRYNKKFDGGIATTTIEILYKYEIAIRNKFSSMTTEVEEQNKEKNEFSSMTTEVEEQNKEKIINRNHVVLCLHLLIFVGFIYSP